MTSTCLVVLNIPQDTLAVGGNQALDVIGHPTIRFNRCTEIYFRSIRYTWSGATFLMYETGVWDFHLH